MRSENPLYWSVRDLRRPEPVCPMPEPIRPPNSGKVFFTCPHCQVTFMLVQQLTGDSTSWEEVWVNSHDHAAMVDAQTKAFGSEDKDYRRPERYTAFDFQRRII